MNFDLEAADEERILKHKELREELMRTSHMMGTSDLVTMTSGNISVRTPEGEVLITPSGIDYEVLQLEDAVLVSIEGKKLEGLRVPSSETPMHTSIYRSRDEVEAIVHTHAPYSTTLACLGWEIPSIHYLLLELSDAGRVPLAPYATPNTEELALRASEALGEVNYACLLQNHGTITVGQTLEEAYSRAQRLEEMAMIYYRVKTAGDPKLISPELLEEMKPRIANYGRVEV